MAQYTATYACGHSETVQLYGKSVDRQKRLDYFKTVDCTSCKNVAATVANAEAGLPSLTGTAKQVAWAETIRAKLVATMDEVVAESYGPAWEEKIGTGEQAEFARRAVTSSRERYVNERSASKWIERRFDEHATLRSMIHADIRIAVGATKA